jgi:hypothetical protein
VTNGYSYDHVRRRGDGASLRREKPCVGHSHPAWAWSNPPHYRVSEGAGRFIYDPNDLLVEQINKSTGTVTYLHHDQADSTRLLTGSTGTVTGK